MSKKAVIWLVISLSIVVTGIGILVYSSVLTMKKTFSSLAQMAETVPPPAEYFYIFNEDAQKNITLGTANKISDGNIIASFFYKNYEVELIVYRLDMPAGLALDKVTKTETGPLIMKHNTTYNEYFTTSAGQLLYNVMPTQHVRELYLRCSGDTVTTLALNDSIAAYYVNAENFSIRYGQDSSYALFGKVRDHNFSKNIELATAFIRKNNKTYLIMAIPRSIFNLPGKNLLLTLL